MSKFLWCLVLFACQATLTKADHPLKKRLRTWETITHDDIIIHRERRSLDSKVPTLDKEVSFKAFDRRFVLSLISSPEILAPGFRATVRSRNGAEEIVLDKSSLYSGTVLGEPGSQVHAHLEDKNLMATIKTKNDTYVVEPSWRHLPEDGINGHQERGRMIVYRQSDLNLTRFNNPHSGDAYCGVESLMKEITEHKAKHDATERGKENFTRQKGEHRRPKRAARKRNKICTLALVADHRFYKDMGNGNRLQTMYYLINLVNRVNKIFKSTRWDVDQGLEEYTGYGFQISDITVYNESTDKPSFNAHRDWTAKGLLEAFSEENHGHCLAHLFTYVDFDKGVLGLAYVGASKADDFGGICTKPYIRGPGKPIHYLNTGLTTALNWGQRILTLEADLVTTHELGHNFGAEHDNGEVKECSPGESNSGNYIMYPAAVSGAYPNNLLFSECSKHNVFRCLESKAPICFVEDKEAFCGNYKVEEGEDCDAGYIVGGVGEEDPCCTHDCKLKPHAECSSKNSVCCNESCQAASSTTLCYIEVPESCLRNTYCDGKNFDCPPHLHKKDNETCGDNGQCKEGICQPYCKTIGKKPCLCSDKEENYCLRCCAPIGTTGDEMTEQCKPHLVNQTLTIKLRNNAKCTRGYCANGECIKQTQDVIERVWSIFEHIAPDKIGEFLADNIVGAVLVFSLLFWVPCGCLVNFVDKQREKQRKREEQQWMAERGSNIYGGMFGSSNAIHKMNKTNRSGVLATRAGLNAKDQWRASQERGLAARRKSQEKLDVGTNGQPSASHAEPLARGDGVIVRVGQTVNPDHQKVKSDLLSRVPGLNSAVIEDSRHGDGYAPGSSRSGTPRPQLMRQNCAIEEEDEDVSS